VCAIALRSWPLFCSFHRASSPLQKRWSLRPNRRQPPGQSAKPADKSGSYSPVYKVGKDVSAPVPLNDVEPEFPKSAKSLKKPFTALVFVSVIIDAQGMTQNPRIFRSYKPDFDAQAIKTVKQYRFKPAMHAGQPVAVPITIEVNFTLF